ncbi:uncharacterized protein RCC_08836 [Ramularia collo-cygni]|uniref:Uncharacterized protein n=1 Tax=Ramularia collo-cygni TaxID=112498 RepID=A0A2D3V155_9PEZI|nr:uncharacterized protein RCC_08836 [Ramularia collo-cygni]CZT23126.1 uncharacterized protein RCC_08836 [Ramularia collo-cygni]
MDHNDGNEEESPPTTSIADKESGNNTTVDAAVSGPWTTQKQEVTVKEEALSDSDDGLSDDGEVLSSSPINRPSTPQEGDFPPETDATIAHNLAELRAISLPSSDFFSGHQRHYKYRKERLEQFFGKYTTWETYPGFTEDMKQEWRGLLVELVTKHHERLMPLLLGPHTDDKSGTRHAKRLPGSVHTRVLRKRQGWFVEAGKPLPEWMFKDRRRN